MMGGADCLNDTRDVAINDNSMLFDTTPEGSDIFEWEAVNDIPRDFIHFHVANDGGTGGPERQRQGPVLENGRKSRPPKLVREVRDLQESLRQLAHNSNALQSALDQKVNQDEFQGACQLVQLALDQKATPDDCQHMLRRADVPEFKASISDMRAALDEKAGKRDAHQICQKLEQKADSATVHAIVCGESKSFSFRLQVVFGFLAAFAAAFAWQESQIQQLRVQNRLLSNSLGELKDLQHVAIEGPTWQFNNSLHGTHLLEETGESASRHDIQVFQSGQITDDIYTVELAPPYTNAWLVVDATMHTSLGTAGLVCRGKADAILALNSKVFGFYGLGPEVEQWGEDDEHSDARTKQTATGSSGISSTRNNANVTAMAGEDNRMATTTTTTKAAQPCMVISLALVERQGKLTNVILSFKRDTQAKTNVLGGHIRSIKGQIQWFQKE
jgi:hypothetical protein